MSVFAGAGSSTARTPTRELAQVLRLPGPEAVARTWTVCRWLEQWLTDLKAFVRPSTLRAYRSVVYYHLMPHLGMYRLSKLRTKTVQRVIDAIARTRVRGGQLISPGTVNRIAAVLRSALSEARRRGMVATTPPGGFVCRRAGGRTRWCGTPNAKSCGARAGSGRSSPSGTSSTW